MGKTGHEGSISEIVTGTLVTSDNKKISFQHFKNGFREVIVIAHGYYNSKQCVTLRNLASSLGDKYDVLMFDFRGHGKSSGVFTWTSREGNDLGAVLDYITPRYSRTGLIAFSVGASIGVNVLARDKRVDRFICVSAPSDMSKIDYRFWKLDWKRDVFYVMFDPAGRSGKGVRIGPFWLPKEKPAQNVHKITAPTMFIHGSQDWVVRPWHSRVLYERTTAPKELVCIENGPHAEFLMRDHPERFVEEVKKWFSVFKDNSEVT